MFYADAPAAPLSFGKKLRYAMEAAGFFLLMGIFKLLGLRLASALGSFIGRNIFSCFSAARRARENLCAAFPEKSDVEIEKLLEEMWDNLGRTVAEYPHFRKFSIHGPHARIQLVGAENATADLTRGKGTILFSGHFANWEVLHLAINQFGWRGGTVVRPVNNPYVDRWIETRRTWNSTNDFVAKGPRGIRRIFATLRRGNTASLLVDQKTNEGVPAPFFGREAMTTPAPAVFALKLGAGLVPVSNRRIGGARFRMEVHPPLAFTPSGDYERDVLDLTALITAKIEEMIRTNPAQWLWIHRRWPTARDVSTGKRGG